MHPKRNLYIIGASHFGREVESWLSNIPEINRDWVVRGYLHSFDGQSPLEGYPSNYQIVGDWKNFPFSPEDYCLIAVADCGWKEMIYNHLKGKVTFYTLISPGTTLGNFNLIGEGSIICPNCIITTNVKLGVCTILNIGCQIGHDVRTGDFCSLMPSVDLGGQIVLGDKVYIGTKATLIPGIKVERDAKVGAGSVVVRTVKKGTTVFGNPAKVFNFK